jgi:hypothetical protein
MLAPDVLVALRRHFARPDVGCVCGHLEYRNPDASETAAVNSAYWRLEERIKQLESDVGSVVGADGSIFAVRRSLYPAVPDDIIDDFYVSLLLLCDGHQVVRADDVRAYELSAVDRRDEFWRKVRIACQAFNVHRLLWPRIRRLPVLTLYAYLSHKLLRWFVAPNLAAAGVLFLAGLAVTAGLRTAVGTTAVALVAMVGAWVIAPGPVRKLREIGLALIATALGVVRSLRGERFQTWAPAPSVRAAAARIDDARG